jgi:gamma-glutamyltranspeptidase / glutathione hydrolase
MRRRAFLATLPALATASAAFGQTRKQNPNRDRRDVSFGDRVDGATFASRSAVWGVHGAAATSQPLATLAAIDILKAGGSAVDAAIAANACLGFLEPTANGIGGDCFAMLWDTQERKVVGINGSGRSPANLTLETVRKRAGNKRLLPGVGAIAVSVPGTVDAWWELHQRYGKLPWKKLFDHVIGYAEEGEPVAQTVAYYLDISLNKFTTTPGIEEIENFRKIWAPQGRTPVEGEVFRNPALAQTFKLIAAGGRDAFYKGEIAEVMERYFKRIGGWLTKADLAAHTSEWTQPIVSNYRGVDVYGLAPNTQGLSTLQMLNIMEQFDLQKMGFQSAALIHHERHGRRSHAGRAWLHVSESRAVVRDHRGPPEWVCASQATFPHDHSGLRGEKWRAVARVRRHGGRHAAAGAGAGHLQLCRLRFGRAGSRRFPSLASRRLERAHR